MRKETTMRSMINVTVTIVLTLITSISIGQWTSVGPGIDYQEYNLSGPVKCYVTRMNRDSTNCIIDSSIGSGQFTGPRETVSQMANRYNDTIGWWGQSFGQRYQVVAAINGDYWEKVGGVLSGFPTSGQIIGGWVARRFMEYSGGSGFAWGVNRNCFLGGDVTNADGMGGARQYFKYQDNTERDINRLNAARTTSNQLFMYTNHYGDRSGTDNTGTEVLVQMTRPDVALPSGSLFALGTVKTIYNGQGNNLIPWDCILLSANGSVGSELSTKCHAGDTINFQMQIKDWGRVRSISLPSQDWTKAYASIGGAIYCVLSSQVPYTELTARSDSATRDPRTVVAFNTTYIYFIVIDGRSSQSIGMNWMEIGEFSINYLNAQFAITQDGGGSSALWVNGQIKNVPSDGSERATENGYLMINVLPMSKSSTFQGMNAVRAVLDLNLRLGPGTQYNSCGTVNAGQLGTIIPHSVNGIYAKNANWWNVRFSSIEGWIQEQHLSLSIPSNHWNIE